MPSVREQFENSWRFGLRTRLWAVVAGLTAVGIALVARYGVGGRVAGASGINGVPNTAAAQRAVNQNQGGAPVAKPPLKTVAYVDDHPITREQLASECLKRHGAEVLSTVTNKLLIVQHCREHQIKITDQDVDEEIQRTAKRFGVPVDQMMTMLETKRGISPEHYASDIVWPTLALRKLAAKQLEVSDDEILKEFETRFGPKVRIRLISVGSRERAEKIRAEAEASPKDFPRLASQYSNDIDSASAGGLIPPVRKHLGEPQLEEAAFSLNPGEISPVIPIHNQFLILKCEEHLAARPPDKAVMKAAEEEIRVAIRDRKLRSAGTDLFKRLQSEAQVENVMNDPAASRRWPGVAARINGQTITIAELAEECIARFGRPTLQQIIARTLIENALFEKQQTVSEQEIDVEIARNAVAADVVVKPGQADMAKWIATITERLHTNEEDYRSNIIWPAVALKKLVSQKVEVTDADLRKGFEASYGPRVRCRAILLDNHRRALQAWDMARRNPTLDNFARLAEEYSVDAASRQIGGEVPPIQKHGGQPALEQEAFALKPGEISGVIQLGEKFVILFCEGQTTPVVINQAEVADLLREDIREKKYGLAMAQEFERLNSSAKVENLLDPTTSHTPRKEVAKSKVRPDDGSEPVEVPSAAAGYPAPSQPNPE